MHSIVNIPLRWQTTDHTRSFQKNTRIRSLERGICPIAAVCTVLLSWSRDPGRANVSETFVRGHVATIPGTCLSNFQFVPLAVLELLAFNAQIFTGVTWPWSRPHRKLLSGVMSELSLGTRLPNFKFIPSAVLEILAFNAQKLRGHVTMITPTFRKYLSGVMSGLSLGTRLPHLKFVSLAVSELLAFNAQKFTGSRDSGHAPFYPIFTSGWRPPRHVVWTMNRYNRSIDDVREAFQVSRWKCITWVPIWGKIG